jgi:uncharacterized CHY-type Zn-finger protein
MDRCLECEYEFWVQCPYCDERFYPKCGMLESEAEETNESDY